MAARSANFRDKLASMRQVALLLLSLPLLATDNSVWSSGAIKVLAADEWCARPGIPDWPEICGAPGAGQTTLFNGSAGAPKGTPYSQILEIQAADAVYVVRRTSLDGGLQFSPGAKAQFLVDGKHLLLKFDREIVDRNGQTHLKREHDRLDILQVKR
jgi:hypothetical protein